MGLCLSPGALPFAPGPHRGWKGAITYGDFQRLSVPRLPDPGDESARWISLHDGVSPSESVLRFQRLEPAFQAVDPLSEEGQPTGQRPGCGLT